MLILASTTAAIQDATDSKDKTEDLFSLFQKANVTVAEIFRQFQADGQTIPQASLNEYNQAFLLAEESRSLLQAGSYSEADSKIIQALQKLKEALRIVYTTLPGAPAETDLEKAGKLGNPYEETSERRQYVENIVNDIFKRLREEKNSLPLK